MVDLEILEKTGIGEANGNSKIDSGKAWQVRWRIALGHKQRDIAKDFGISQTQVWRIKTGQQWCSTIEES
jgi:DNA invertase Pin-like site-specific DNA recombinase